MASSVMSNEPNEVATVAPARRAGERWRLSLSGADLIRSTRQNVSACQRWFRVIVWALDQHPQGLFIQELKSEYQRLCKLQNIGSIYNDEGEFRNSLSRQLAICIGICSELGWVKSQLERPTRLFNPGIRNKKLIPQSLWILTNAGHRASRFSEPRLTRVLTIFLIKRGLEPIISRVRLPLAVASMAIGAIKLIKGWNELQTTIEGMIVVAGASVLAMARLSYDHR
jgi:hypothetical protein